MKNIMDELYGPLRGRAEFAKGPHGYNTCVERQYSGARILLYRLKGVLENGQYSATITALNLAIDELTDGIPYDEDDEPEVTTVPLGGLD